MIDNLLPTLVAFMLLGLGYAIGRIHSWFLELIWRDATGKHLSRVARLGNTELTARAIAAALEMDPEADRAC